MVQLKHFGTAMVGPLKAGKTYASLGAAKTTGLPIVVLVAQAENENKLLTSIPFVRASAIMTRPGALVQLARGKGAVRVWIDRDAKGAFDWFQFLNGHLKFAACVIIDDFRAIFLEEGEKKHFAAWASMVRHTGTRFLITVQRYFGAVPPFVRSIVGQIFVMGPILRWEDAQDLYDEEETTGAQNLEAFARMLRENPAYNPLSIKG